MFDVGALWAYVHETVFNKPVLFKSLELVLTIVLGYMGLKLVMRLVSQALEHHSTEHIRKMLLHVVYYVGVLVIFISVLHQLNFQIGALLGAAGIFTAAIGFASQTSVSNIISGLFLLSEGPYQIGDYIEVAGAAGTVDSIDLLSVKLRQANGTFIRVPHATIITNNVVNASYYNERRLDFKVLVSNKEDVRKVMRVIAAVVQDNKFSLKEKAPFIVCEELGESSFKIQVGVWSDQKNWLDLKDSILPEMQERFIKEQIMMPLPMYVSFEKNETY